VAWQTPRPIRLGSRFAFVAQFLVRRLEYVYEVVEHVPEKRFMMRTTEGPFPMETTYEWEPTETGTRMTLINRGTPSRDHTRSRARRAGDAMAADDGSRDSDHPVACRAA
jgi:hypothetical protein